MRLGGLRARFWRLRASILEPPGLDFGGSRPRFSSLQANMRRKNCFNGIYTISIRDLYFHALKPLRSSNDPAHKFPPPFFVLALTHADCARCPCTLCYAMPYHGIQMQVEAQNARARASSSASRSASTSKVARAIELCLNKQKP